MYQSVSRSTAIAALFCVAALCARTQVPDQEQQLRNRLQGKTFLLRGFYAGNHLRFDSVGNLIGNAPSGDWTVDGFVKVEDIQLSGGSLKIKAERRIAVTDDKGFRFLSVSAKERKKKRELQIEVDADPAAVDRRDAVPSMIFFGAQDNLREHVPDYWSDCVSAGSGRCNFSPEMVSVPGIASTPHSQAPQVDNAKATVPIATGDHHHPVKPPMPISHPDPQFMEEARKAGVTGLVTLETLVDSSGRPTNIKILSPLGYGLDAEAVRTLATWKFKPATKDGQPVAVKIAIEMDFHLYY